MALKENETKTPIMDLLNWLFFEQGDNIGNRTENFLENLTNNLNKGGYSKATSSQAAAEMRQGREGVLGAIDKMVAEKKSEHETKEAIRRIKGEGKFISNFIPYSVRNVLLHGGSTAFNKKNEARRAYKDFVKQARSAKLAQQSENRIKGNLVIATACDEFSQQLAEYMLYNPKFKASGINHIDTQSKKGNIESGIAEALKSDEVIRSNGGNEVTPDDFISKMSIEDRTKFIDAIEASLKEKSQKPQSGAHNLNLSGGNNTLTINDLKEAVKAAAAKAVSASKLANQGKNQQQAKKDFIAGNMTVDRQVNGKDEKHVTLLNYFNAHQTIGPKIALITHDDMKVITDTEKVFQSMPVKEREEMLSSIEKKLEAAAEATNSITLEQVSNAFISAYAATPSAKKENIKALLNNEHDVDSFTKPLALLLEADPKVSGKVDAGKLAGNIQLAMEKLAITVDIIKGLEPEQRLDILERIAGNIENQSKNNKYGLQLDVVSAASDALLPTARQLQEQTIGADGFDAHKAKEWLEVNPKLKDFGIDANRGEVFSSAFEDVLHTDVLATMNTAQRIKLMQDVELKLLERKKQLPTHKFTEKDIKDIVSNAAKEPITQYNKDSAPKKISDQKNQFEDLLRYGSEPDKKIEAKPEEITQAIINIYNARVLKNGKEPPDNKHEDNKYKEEITELVKATLNYENLDIKTQKTLLIKFADTLSKDQGYNRGENIIQKAFQLAATDIDKGRSGSEISNINRILGKLANPTANPTANAAATAFVPTVVPAVANTDAVTDATTAAAASTTATVVPTVTVTDANTNTNTGRSADSKIVNSISQKYISVDPKTNAETKSSFVGHVVNLISHVGSRNNSVPAQ
jgi:hypothetical protein